MTPFQEGGVRGFLHPPGSAISDALVLAHSAGGNANAPLLVSVAEAFAEAGMLVLRIDLPFRQNRLGGPPPFGSGPADRANILEACEAVHGLGATRVFLGGHSYGGRMASMLAAEQPDCAQGLVALAYPLHAPGKPKLRTEHFPALRMPALFVSGDRDTFGLPDELRAAVALVAGPAQLSLVEHAGHDLKGGKFAIADLVIGPLWNLLSSVT